MKITDKYRLPLFAPEVEAGSAEPEPAAPPAGDTKGEKLTIRESLERGFEDAITGSLVEVGGYRVCKWGTKREWAGDFNPKLGLDTAELLAFIAETQPAAWKRLLEVHGGPDGILQGARVGIDFAREEDRLRPWRFAIAGTPWVTQRAKLG